MADRADDLDQGDSHPQTERLPLLCLRCLALSQIVLKRFFAEVLQLIDELVDTLLRLLTLGHLRAHSFLCQAPRLSVRLA